MYIIYVLSCILVISVNLTNAESPANPCSEAMTDLPPARDSKCCGIQSIRIRFESRIVGGSVTEFEDYPWLVAIQYEHLNDETGDVEKKVYCGGSLISGMYVLTAAHCLYRQRYWVPKNVLLGAFNVTTTDPVCKSTSEGDQECTDEVIVNPINKMIIHPQYTPRGSINDVALIKLNTTAPFTDFIRPICLPTRDYITDPPEPFALYVAGWGIYQQYDNGSDVYSDVKRYVRVPYVNKTACEQAYGFRFSSAQLCAGGEVGKGPCKGDSGGPLMYKDDKTVVAIGILSYGPTKCDLENAPDVFTNVYVYLPWIRSTIEAESNTS